MTFFRHSNGLDGGHRNERKPVSSSRTLGLICLGLAGTFGCGTWEPNADGHRRYQPRSRRSRSAEKGIRACLQKQGINSPTETITLPVPSPSRSFERHFWVTKTAHSRRTAVRSTQGCGRGCFSRLYGSPYGRGITLTACGRRTHLQ